MAARSKAWYCGNSPAEIVGSNPTVGVRGAWMSVCCDCCVLLGRGLCEKLITSPEESYQLWCVNVCDRETTRMEEELPPPWAAAPLERNFAFNILGIKLAQNLTCYILLISFVPT